MNSQRKRERFERTELAVQRTKLANQRTFLAYMRTGFAVSAIAGAFKQFYLMLFGMAMLIMSSIQYYFITQGVHDSDLDYSWWYDYFPLAFAPLAMAVVYLQYIAPKVKSNRQKAALAQ